MKTCTRCNVKKKAGAFNAHGSSKDGLQSWCRECARDYDVARRKAGKVPKPPARRRSKRVTKTTCELEAVKSIACALQPLKVEQRERVLAMVELYLA
jgi:hypothetical protein